MISYGVYISMNISNHQYDLAVKGQGQINIKFVLQLLTQTYFNLLTEGVHIWHNECLWFVDYNKCLICLMAQNLNS